MYSCSMVHAYMLTYIQAGRQRETCRSQILKSRMVRRKKPVPSGTSSTKADGGCARFALLCGPRPSSETFAATLQTEVINMFFQAAASSGLKVVFGDVTPAFCQSKPLSRAQGRLSAKPTPGLPDQALQCSRRVHQSS